MNPKKIHKAIWTILWILLVVGIILVPFTGGTSIALVMPLAIINFIKETIEKQNKKR
ncbi:MAG: hypothetical protein IIU74_07550 [Ruminiclostridium sp.]|nr:hypothetical protein [Ruminiclostridium sp.]